MLTFARHLDLLSELVEQGHMKPISPIKVFSFEEMGDAFRFLGSGKHIGKLIISNGEEAEKAEVTVRRFRLEYSPGIVLIIPNRCILLSAASQSL